MGREQGVDLVFRTLLGFLEGHATADERPHGLFLLAWRMNNAQQSVRIKASQVSSIPKIVISAVPTLFRNE